MEGFHVLFSFVCPMTIKVLEWVSKTSRNCRQTNACISDKKLRPSILCPHSLKTSILRISFRVLRYFFWPFVTGHREPQLASGNGSYIIRVFTCFFHFVVCWGSKKYFS